MINENLDDMSSHTIIGYPVVDQTGEEVGTIEGILPDAENRADRIVIVGFSESFNYPDQVFGVLSSVLKFDPDTQRFVLDADRSRLSATHRVSKRHWHEIPYEQWSSESYGVALLDIVSAGQTTQDYFTPER